MCVRMTLTFSHQPLNVTPLKLQLRSMYKQTGHWASRVRVVMRERGHRGRENERPNLCVDYYCLLLPQVISVATLS